MIASHPVRLRATCGLDELGTERDRYALFKHSALAALIAAVAAALFVAVSASHAGGAGKTGPVSGTSTPADLAAPAGVRWIEPNPDLIRRVQWLAVIPMAVAPLTLLSVYATGRWFFDSSQLHLLVSGALAAAGGLLWLRAGRTYPALGTDGRLILARDWRRGIETHSPQDARLTARTLWLGQRMVPLVNVHKTPVYDPDRVDRHIRPRWTRPANNRRRDVPVGGVRRGTGTAV